MLVLASASPRRQELLRNAEIQFTVEPAHVNEDFRTGEDAVTYVRRLAYDKAMAIWMTKSHAWQVDHNFVLGADTTVVVDGEMLAKPVDRADAARMLRMLSGKTHEVVTGVCLLGDFKPRGSDTRHEITRVTFDPLTDADIEMYVVHGEPMDKAGAYAIQGIASRWIPRIEGCYFNVVGLPVPLVCRMLREHDLKHTRR